MLLSKPFSNYLILAIYKVLYQQEVRLSQVQCLQLIIIDINRQDKRLFFQFPNQYCFISSYNYIQLLILDFTNSLYYCAFSRPFQAMLYYYSVYNYQPDYKVIKQFSLSKKRFSDKNSDLLKSSQRYNIFLLCYFSVCLLLKLKIKLDV